MVIPHTISAPRLFLRRFTPSDARKVFLMSREEGIRKWIPSQVYRDETHAAEVLARLISHYGSGGDPRKGPLVLGVELKTNNELVGHVGLSPFEGTVEIAYAIERAHQSVGLASEAATAFCHWAANEYQLENIVGVTARENTASQGVLLRAGFVRKEERVMCIQGERQPAAIYEVRARNTA